MHRFQKFLELVHILLTTVIVLHRICVRTAKYTPTELTQDVLVLKLQLLHARMQQVKQAEEDAFKAANARGANIMSNLGRLELKLQGSAVSSARTG